MTTTKLDWLNHIAHPEGQSFRKRILQDSLQPQKNFWTFVGFGLLAALPAIAFWLGITAMAFAASSAHAQNTQSQQVSHGPTVTSPTATEATGPSGTSSSAAESTVPVTTDEMEAVTETAQEVAQEIVEGMADEGSWQPQASIPAGERRQDTAVLAGDTVSVDGSGSDVFAFGQSATVNGEVRDNLFAFAQSVSVPASAHIGGDVYAFANSVDLSSPVDGDIYSFSAHLRIQPGANVSGNVHAFAGNVSIEAPVAGNVNIYAGNARINASVGGDVRAEVGQLELGPEARIGGKLHYLSHDDLTRDPAATVAGAITHAIPKDEKGDDIGVNDDDDEDSVASTVFWKTTWLVAAWLIGAFLLWAGGRFALKPVSVLLDMPGASIGLGFVGVFAVPIIAILAMVLVITIPASLLVLLMYGPALYVGKLITAMALGLALARSLRRDVDSSKYLSLALGLLVLTAASLVPFLGFIATCAAYLVGFGALLIAPFVKLGAAVPPPSAAVVPA